MSTAEPSSHPAFSYADGIAATWRDFLLLCARILVSWIYVQSGVSKVMNIPAFVKSTSRLGVPEFLGYLAPWVEVTGGALILLGAATRYAELLVLTFTIVATFLSHRFWTYPEAQQAAQSVHFWKNVSMMGGQVLLFITGAGRFSVDYLLRRR